MNNIMILGDGKALELRLRGVEIMELRGLCEVNGNERGLMEFAKGRICSPHHRRVLRKAFPNECQRVTVFWKQWR